MLSGDRDNIAKEVAQTLGLDVYRAQLLPDEKVRAMEELTEQEPGGTLFVGDGVNDAPAMASASSQNHGRRSSARLRGTAAAGSARSVPAGVWFMAAARADC